MDNAVALLREKVSKAEIKLQRAQKGLETAQTELADLQTALRVFEALTSTGPTGSTAGGASAAVLDRQRWIVNLLNGGKEKSYSPAELYEAYALVRTEDIPIDTFRTTLWRMKDRLYEDQNGDLFVVCGEGGRYWKERAIDLSNEADDVFSMEPNPPLDGDIEF